ncbi:MAG: response regulator [Treponema sp.]|nr:response regulator [Treponema sp.]
MNYSAIDSGSRFLASTLHEVRTPIQTIISTTELLEDTTLDKEQTEYVRQIEFSANVLLQLANDVLDFTKIRSKEFKLESIPYDIIELTEHVVDLISIDAFNKGLELITDIDYSMPATVMGDPTRMQQILLNLVKNAVKFTSRGYILVRLSHENNNLYFQVIDSGIGVIPEKQSLIFKDFYQVDASTTRKYGGTGLGLAISKNLVEIMNGKIGMRSNPKGGSIFWFSIPLIQSSFDIEKKERPLIPEGTRILIIDSNSLSLSSFGKKLYSLGINRISGAKSAQEALSKLKQACRQRKPFTTVFINIPVLEQDDWKIVSEIREEKCLSKIKLILMLPEGQMRRNSKKKMLNMFDSYLYKPLKRESLLSLFNNKTPPEQLLARQKYEQGQKNLTVAAGNQILIAEDHPVNRKLLETFLERYGAKVYLAENGVQVIEQIVKHPEIDLIFMDIFMPVKNGIDATVEIRNMSYKGIIIACTANSDPDDFKQYKKMGINDILVKPYRRESVKKMLDKWNTVLLFPEAKKIVSLTETNNKAAEIWDLADFTDTTNEDKELAKSLMDDYIAQTQKFLGLIKRELANKDKNFDNLKYYAHTLKGSSSAVSVHKLAEYSKKMEEAVTAKDLTSFESIRVNFAVDFLTLKQLVKSWKSAL